MSDPEFNDLRRALIAALPAALLAEQAGAQDAAKMQPQSYRVAMENEHVRVLDFNSRPGLGVCGTGMHSHPAHVTVLLTTGNVRVRTPDGKTQEIHDLPFGTVFWEDPVTHMVENISGNAMRSLIIELKPAKV